LSRLISRNAAMQFNGHFDEGETVTCPGSVEDIAAAILIFEDFFAIFRQDMGTGAENIVFDPVLAGAEIVSDNFVTIRDIFLLFPGIGDDVLCVFQGVREEIGIYLAIRPTSTTLIVSWSGMPLS